MPPPLHILSPHLPSFQRDDARSPRGRRARPRGPLHHSFLARPISTSPGRILDRSPPCAGQHRSPVAHSNRTAIPAWPVEVPWNHTQHTDAQIRSPLRASSQRAKDFPAPGLQVLLVQGGFRSRTIVLPPQRSLESVAHQCARCGRPLRCCSAIWDLRGATTDDPLQPINPSAERSGRNRACPG